MSLVEVHLGQEESVRHECRTTGLLTVKAVADEIRLRLAKHFESDFLAKTTTAAHSQRRWRHYKVERLREGKATSDGERRVL